MTLDDLSLRSGVSKRMISAYEANENDITLSKLRNIAMVLDVSILELIEDGSMIKTPPEYSVSNVDQEANVKDKDESCKKCSDNNATINSLNGYIRVLEKRIEELGGNLNSDRPLPKTGTRSP